MSTFIGAIQIEENKESIYVITTFLGPVRKPLIDNLPNLKLIAVGAVGVDHIDIGAAKMKNVSVTNTPDVLTDDAADMAMGLIIALNRRIVEGDAFIRAGMWGNQKFPLGNSLARKILGIVGLGRIGRAVAKRAEAFSMNVKYTGPNDKNVNYTYISDINDLASQSDILVCTCLGGDETEHMINYNVLGHLGAAGYFVNVARGSVVKQDDLLVALQNKTIAGAALDVFEAEPNVPDAFFVMDNVVLTPHMGSATKETRKKMGDIVVSNVISCLSGGKPLTPV